MHALIVEEDDTRRNEIETAFKKAGFLVTATGSQTIAESCIRFGLVDLLIMAERIGGRLTHKLSLLAECRNAMVETILMTHRSDEDVEELFLLLPSLHCLVAPDAAPQMLIKLSIAALNSAQQKAREQQPEAVFMSRNRQPSVSKDIPSFQSKRTRQSPETEPIVFVRACA